MSNFTMEILYKRLLLPLRKQLASLVLIQDKTLTSILQELKNSTHPALNVRLPCISEKLITKLNSMP